MCSGSCVADLCVVLADSQTFVLEFIPYLGAAVMIALLAITAFATFESLGHILMIPGAYLLVTTLQNNVVSPIAYGNGMKLNPVAVFIGVILWWFLWGIPGAFLAAFALVGHMNGNLWVGVVLLVLCGTGGSLFNTINQTVLQLVCA